MNTRQLYGFEDYTIVSLDCSTLAPDRYNSSIWNLWAFPTGYYIADKKFSKEKYLHDNKELLKDGIKIYIHPECKIPRSLIQSKYSKSLSPWSADVAVIPDACQYIQYNNCLLFANEQTKILVWIHIPSSFLPKINISSFSYNTPLKEYLKVDIENSGDDYGIKRYNVSYKDIKEAEFIYEGPILGVNDKNKYILELVSGMLPLNKTVFESSLMQSLGSEENNITFDNLLSIYNMLISTDDTTVGVALKTLSAMDYFHYPQSVSTILQRSKHNYWYNKARHATSVKYMINSLKSSDKCHIRIADYELYKKLVMHFNKIYEDDVIKYMMHLPFMSVNYEGKLVPKLCTD